MSDFLLQGNQSQRKEMLLEMVPVLALDVEQLSLLAFASTVSPAETQLLPLF